MGFEDLIADAKWTTSLPSMIVGLVSAVLTYFATTASVRKKLKLAEAEFERKYHPSILIPLTLSVKAHSYCNRRGFLKKIE